MIIIILWLYDTDNHYRCQYIERSKRMSTLTSVQETGDQYLIRTFRRSPIILSHGKGVRVWDVQGKEYLDFLGGFAVNTLGHCHPNIVRAVNEQMSTLIHSSNLFYNQPAVKLAKMLAELGAGDQLFFCPSGAEAIEGALKLARKYQYMRGATHKTRFISALKSYHGRTYGALSASGKPEMQQGFGPLLDAFTYIPFNDIEALQHAMGEDVCAIILEPIQGEAGAHIGKLEFLQAARELCNQYGALLIFDEIQTGMGRTGTFFAYQNLGVKPDILTLAKGISGGLPNAAFAALQHVAEAFQPGDHGSTFGANPVMCAAGIATIETIMNEHLLENIQQMGNYLLKQLQLLKEKHSCVAEVRGQGLLLAMQLSTDNKPIADEANNQGLLLAAGANNILRFLPPFIITKQDVDEAVQILDYALSKTNG